MRWTAVAGLLLVSVAIQAFVASALLRPSPRGPFRSLAAVLFGLNAVVAALIAVAALADGRLEPGVALRALDAPTGTLLLFLGVVASSRAPLSSVTWPRTLVAGLVTAALGCALATVLLFLDPAAFDAWASVPYEKAPLFLGLSLLTIALARRLVRESDGETAWVVGLLLVGFGARAAEFAWLYGVHQSFLSGAGILSDAPMPGLDAAVRLALPVAVIFGLALLLRAAARGPETARRPARLGAVALAAAAASAVVQVAEPGGHEAPATRALSLLTLVVVRPLFVGFALDRERTLRGFAAIGVAVGLFVAVKGVASAAFDRNALDVSSLDALAALAVPLAWPAVAALRRTRAASTGPTSRVRASVAEPEPAQPLIEAATRTPLSAFPETAAERVAVTLAHARSVQGPGAWVGKSDLCAVAGVSDKSVADALRRLDRQVQPFLAPDAGRVVESRTVGVKARAEYRLTAAGEAAVRALAAARGRPVLEASDPPESPGRPEPEGEAQDSRA